MHRARCSFASQFSDFTSFLSPPRSLYDRCVNATAIFDVLFDFDRRLLEEPTFEGRRRMQEEEFLLQYLETEFYCTWKMIFDAPKTKRGEKTVLSGSSLRSAIEAEEDFVDGRTGNLATNKHPLFVSSVVMGLPPLNPGRKLQVNPFLDAYTQYTITYSKLGGWNPLYLSSSKYGKE